MNDFSKLIATIQTLKHLNPLQVSPSITMGDPIAHAIRFRCAELFAIIGQGTDSGVYASLIRTPISLEISRYEVNEPRMNDDCGQYLAQLQKDWERQRVKLGVEALRKEVK